MLLSLIFWYMVCKDKMWLCKGVCVYVQTGLGRWCHFLPLHKILSQVIKSLKEEVWGHLSAVSELTIFSERFLLWGSPSVPKKEPHETPKWQVLWTFSKSPESWRNSSRLPCSGDLHGGLQTQLRILTKNIPPWSGMRESPAFMEDSWKNYNRKDDKQPHGRLRRFPWGWPLQSSSKTTFRVVQ